MTKEQYDKKELKRRKSLNFQAKRASDCRHDKCVVSCASCKDREGCEIQASYKKALDS